MSEPKVPVFWITSEHVDSPAVEQMLRLSPTPYEMAWCACYLQAEGSGDQTTVRLIRGECHRPGVLGRAWRRRLKKAS